MEEPPSEPQHRAGENCSSLISNSLADIESSLQRDAEAAYVHPEVGLHSTHQLGILVGYPSAGSGLLSLLSTALVPQYSQAALAQLLQPPLLLLQVGVLGKADVIAAGWEPGTLWISRVWGTQPAALCSPS